MLRYLIFGCFNVHLGKPCLALLDMTLLGGMSPLIHLCLDLCMEGLQTAGKEGLQTAGKEGLRTAGKEGLQIGDREGLLTVDREGLHRRLHILVSPFFYLGTCGEIEQNTERLYFL